MIRTDKSGSFAICPPCSEDPLALYSQTSTRKNVVPIPFMVIGKYDIDP